MCKSIRTHVVLFTFALLFAFPVAAFAAPSITSITPNTANNWGMVQITELTGAGFEEGAMVTLVREGQPDVEVLAIVESSTKISGMFELRREEPGSWDVVVTNPDEQNATLIGGFTLTTPPAPTITSNTPDLTDNMGYATIELTGDNFLAGAEVKLIREGLSDIEAVLVMVESPTKIICEFNLTGVEVGHWNIMVINPDGQTGTSNSIDVTQSDGSEVFIVTSNTDFYVDAVNGDDANDGLTPTTAWKTITYALNHVSGSGITVHVAEGNYIPGDPCVGETFPVRMRRGISLVGAGADNTILDAQSTSRVISCWSIGTDVTIEGFTIKNGNAHYAGGGIYCRNSSPTITNCTISSNSPTYYGGGIYCGYSSSPTITNCTISSNSAGWYGGGIWCWWRSSPTITNCTIRGNSASRGAGGIYCYKSSPTITNCTISSNSAGTGGGINCYYASPTITNCTINDNSVSWNGGGIYCYKSSPTVTNCTISNNSAYRGGGIWCAFSSPAITNCTISSNSATYGGGINCYYASSPYIVNTILWSNGSEIYTGWDSNPKLSYCDIQGGYSGLGNIDADPQFVDPGAGDYHLRADSPCIDAGHPRIYDSDNSRSDMGAYGGEGGSDPNPINITVAANGSGDYTSIQNAIDFAVTGDTITVLPGIYTENLVMAGKDISLISQDGAGSTVINGSGSKSVIVFANVGSGAMVQGFTIQNGSAYYGSGVACWDSSLTITNCTISSNSARYGGGIFCNWSSSPMITNCTISGNIVNTYGGGIFCSSSSSPTITNCTISSNTANAGGGIYCNYYSSPTITNCTISGNTANAGGGIYCDYSTLLTITNCTISGNSASSYGGGIFCYWSRSSPIITNCTISNNLADYGGGIYCDYYSSPIITNCTISNNLASSYGGGTYCSRSSSPTVVNSILWGDMASGSPNEIYLDGSSTIDITYSDIQGDDPDNPGQPYPGTGNINADPLFVDPANGNYRLAIGSPCIDKGTDDTVTYPTLPIDDIDGDPRPRGLGYDMGSDEFASPFLSPDTLWPPNHDMVPVTIDVSGLVMDYPDAQIRITSVDITEYSRQKAGEAYGENIYDENNFEPDVEVTGDLTLNLRSERTGATTGRTYTITVTATDSSGDYTFTTEVIVPQDKAN